MDKRLFLIFVCFLLFFILIIGNVLSQEFSADWNKVETWKNLDIYNKIPDDFNWNNIGENGLKAWVEANGISPDRLTVNNFNNINFALGSNVFVFKSAQLGTKERVVLGNTEFKQNAKYEITPEGITAKLNDNPRNIIVKPSDVENLNINTNGKVVSVSREGNVILNLKGDGFKFSQDKVDGFYSIILEKTKEIQIIKGSKSHTIKNLASVDLTIGVESLSSDIASNYDLFVDSENNMINFVESSYFTYKSESELEFFKKEGKEIIANIKSLFEATPPKNPTILRELSGSSEEELKVMSQIEINGEGEISVVNKNLQDLLKENPEVKTNQDLINYFYKKSGWNGRSDTDEDYENADKYAIDNYGFSLDILTKDRKKEVLIPTKENLASSDGNIVLPVIISNVPIKNKQSFSNPKTFLQGSGVSSYDINTNLRAYRPISVKDLNFYFDKKGHSELKKLSPYFMQAAYENNIDPYYITSHFILETGWGSSKIWKDHKNGFGIGAFDATPYSGAAKYAHNTDEAGIMEGVKWIKKKYLSQGAVYESSNLDEMNKNYAMDPIWDKQISNIMNEILHS